jgi:hypothetical protein
MTSFHSIYGLVVAAAFTAVAALGWWRWRASESSPLFWRALRACQVLYLGYLVIAAVRFFSGEKPHDDLYWIYALLPLAVSFFAEQLRIAAAQQVLEQRDLEDAKAVGRLPAAEQRGVVVAILRREMGVMAIAAIVIAGLMLRASLGFGGY